MPTNFTALDLLAWHESGTLELSPKFQRRAVWTPAAKGFFIDTLLRGYPVPPLHIRMLSTKGSSSLRREVIDGQQRLRALFDFLDGRLQISRGLDSPWAGMVFGQITDKEREVLRITQFHVYQYQAIDDATVLEIFARLNTYSVALNAQELRNGKYFGEFKALVYRISWDYLDLWRSTKIFSEAALARMGEAELVSELLVAQLDGLQDKKKSLDMFYAGLDTEWPDSRQALMVRKGKTFDPKAWLSRNEADNRFRSTMSEIVDSVGDLISITAFRRVPLFYTLFCVVYDALYGLPGAESNRSPKPLSGAEVASLRGAVEEFSSLLSLEINDDAISSWQRDLVLAATRQTDNLGPRQRMFEGLRQLAQLD